jgi:hypothetical protein
MTQAPRGWLPIVFVILFVVVPALAFANGESVNGFPNWGERVLLEWMNRARSDPQADLAGCDNSSCPDKACYQPVAPRHIADQFEHSARFHATHMLLNGYFDYPSHCGLVSNIAALYPDTCNGLASCSCVGGTLSSSQTDPFTRISLFGLAGQTEIIIAEGFSGPDAIFYTWLYNRMTDATCSNGGFRTALLQNANNAAGAGYTTEGSTAGPGVMDIGSSSTAAPKIPSGVHYPRQAASVDAWMNWYDSAAPTVAKIDVDGVCSTMSEGRGLSAGNSAWHFTANNVGTGCHHYVFAFKDYLGGEQIYPTTGALTIGDGGEQCPDFSEQPPSGCAGFDRIFVSGLEL